MKVAADLMALGSGAAKNFVKPFSIARSHRVYSGLQVAAIRKCYFLSIAQAGGPLRRSSLPGCLSCDSCAPGRGGRYVGRARSCGSGRRLRGLMQISMQSCLRFARQI